MAKENFSNVISNYTVLANVIIVVLILILFLIYFNKNKKKISKINNKILTAMLTYMFFYTGYILLLKAEPSWKILGNYTLAFTTFATIIYIATLFISTILLFKKSKNFYNIIFVLIIIAGLLAPLFVVNPIGPRNFFMIYVLEIIFVLYIANEVGINYKKFNKYIVFCLIIAFTYYVSIYSYISLISYRRDHYIEYKSINSSDTTIIVPKLPYGKFVWLGDFYGDYRTNFYKIKHNLRTDITFKFVDYDAWCKHIKNENYKAKHLFRK